MMLALFQFGLAVHRVTGEGKGFEAVVFDRLFTDLANTVITIFDSFEGLVNLVKGSLLLGEHAEGKITVVGVAAGIGLVHAEGRGFAAGMEIVACDTPHGIQEGILKVEEALVLLGEERGELEVLVDLGLLDELLGQNAGVGVRYDLGFALSLGGFDGLHLLFGSRFDGGLLGGGLGCLFGGSLLRSRLGSFFGSCFLGHYLLDRRLGNLLGNGLFHHLFRGGFLGRLGCLFDGFFGHDGSENEVLFWIGGFWGRGLLPASTVSRKRNLADLMVKPRLP